MDEKNKQIKAEENNRQATIDLTKIVPKLTVEQFLKDVQDMPIELLEHLKTLKAKVYASKWKRTKESQHGVAYTIGEVEKMALDVGLDIIWQLPVIPLKSNGVDFLGFTYQVFYKENKKTKLYKGRQVFPASNIKEIFQFTGDITYSRRQIILILLGFGNDDTDQEFMLKKRELAKYKAITKEMLKKDPQFVKKVKEYKKTNQFSSKSLDPKEWAKMLKAVPKINLEKAKETKKDDNSKV